MGNKNTSRCFSGIGGFELGIQRAFDIQPEVAQLQMETNISNDNSSNIQRTASCIGHSKLINTQLKVYERQFNGHTNYGTNQQQSILPNSPDFDLLVGDFLAKHFSIAGKKKRLTTPEAHSF